jgi:hypothetical protein
MYIKRLLPLAVASFLWAYLVLPHAAFSAPFGRSHVVHWYDNRGPNLWNGSYPLTCDNCHIDNTVHHETPILFNDSKELAETTVCDGCHSKGGAFDGVAMAKANWVSGVYTGTNYENLQTGKEQWCTTCHDDVAPTINGRTADNVTGDNTVYGYFISGHGKYNVICTDCHDPQLVHIDGYDRTYAVGGGTARNYTNGYRLKLISGNTPMVIPRSGSYSSSQFRLCYWCHDESAIISDSPILTDFADIPSSNQNLHSYHLESTGSNKWWDSDLSGETSMPEDSTISCPACHNPHGKDYNNRATISMTRQDLGLVHKRDVTGLFGHMESNDWSSPGGDVNCFGMCHQSPNPAYKYYYQLGTRTPEAPRFWTKLDSETDVTNPTYGIGGTLLGVGGTFVTYDKYGVTETGLNVVSANQGCEFPATNLSVDNDLYGETIDFWYVPNFNFSGNTTVRFLFNYHYGSANWIKIRVVDSQIYFEIKKGGTVHTLASANLTWGAGTPHHIVCTWGPAQGMHMYLDKVEPSYSTSDGLGYFEGITQVPTYFYIGIQNDGTNPANGIIDDFKLYGYQYQNFEGDITLFSKMGSAGEITTPIKGNGGSVGGSVGFASGQQGYGAQFSATYNGVVNFPTSNLNPEEDTIDLWYRTNFNIGDNTDSKKHLFWYTCDADNNAFIKVDENTLNFTIREGGTDHTLRTTAIANWDWYHIVCTWGPDRMHMYIDDKEASYSINDGLSYTGGLPTTGMPANFKIGNKTSGGNSYCDGIIDELRVYGYQGSPQYLEFLVDCPVDIQVIDPNGRIVDKFRSEIRGAQYIEQDFNGDGSIDDKIIIPNPRIGNYTVLVIPEPGADPADTYTLKVINGENPLIITQNAPIGDIDGEETFEVTFTSEGIKLAKLLSPKDHAILSEHVTFDWESIGYDGFKIQFSSDRSFGQRGKARMFGNRILTFPYSRGKWLSETSFTLTKKEWQEIKRISRRNSAIYWRVIVADAEGNIGVSETRSFTVFPSQKK